MFTFCHPKSIYIIPAKPLHNRDTVSGHFNLCMRICDTLKYLDIC